VPADCEPTALPSELHPQFEHKKVLPGFEPGLQGSEPWVLTNYTLEPNIPARGVSSVVEQSVAAR
jgi:hypothetical protein